MTLPAHFTAWVHADLDRHAQAHVYRVENYCPTHGGEADPEWCEHEDHPVPPPAPCTCASVGGIFGWDHHPTCARYLPPLTDQLPLVSATRGGITYPTPQEPTP